MTATIPLRPPREQRDVGRGLADIDLYVPFGRAEGLLEEVEPFVTWGPERHAGGEWNLTFLKIDYRGQRIELGDSSTAPCYFNRKVGRWEEQRIDYGSSVTVGVFGVEVEAMRKTSSSATSTISDGRWTSST